MERRYETVDVFTDRAFGGNPLAVVLDCAGLDAAAMQRIAREFNYSETTFVLPPASPGHHHRVRIFTPRQELPFAGHPNVGTAFVLARALPSGAVPDPFLFEEGAGTVPVRPLVEGGVVVGAELTAPQPLRRDRVPDPDAVAAALGLPPEALLLERHAPEIVSVGLPVLTVELTDPTHLARTGSDLAAMTALLGDRAAVGLYPYVRLPSDPGSPRRLRARLFAPADAIPEDPATGSAAAALAALQFALDPGAGPALRLAIEQGVEMGRPSLIEARVEPREAGAPSVHVAGHCVPIMRGHLVLPPER
ncbi:MAG: PhzF family phenazine biosynthesis protein [Gluconacetobacter diazotrophicus]|nr:PhzF family phenazine biosynthesis protein [Gluconacetobacter diazotrophicus]